MLKLRTLPQCCFDEDPLCPPRSFGRTKSLSFALGFRWQSSSSLNYQLNFVKTGQDSVYWSSSSCRSRRLSALAARRGSGSYCARQIWLLILARGYWRCFAVSDWTSFLSRRETESFAAWTYSALAGPQGSPSRSSPHCRCYYRPQFFPFKAEQALSL